MGERRRQKEFYVHLTFLTSYLAVPCYTIDSVISGRYPGTAKGNCMVKIYVVDTNVLLQAPYALESFEDNQVVLPMIVLEELD